MATTGLAMVLIASGSARGIEKPRAPARQQPQESVAAAQEVSRFRQENGLGAVVSDAQLVAAARIQADAMARAGVMSHDIGGSFASRIRKAGIQAGSAAENVAMGQVSLKEAMESWKASSGHRSNMLARSATRIGLARANGAGGRPFWALILASPEPKPGQRPPGEDRGPFQWGPAPPWSGLLGH
jgi:uncharacterized protein YkwD